MTGTRRRNAGTAVALACVVAGACGVSVPVATDRCRPAVEGVLAAIRPGMKQGGLLRNGFIVQSTEFGRVWLVSAEFLDDGQPEDQGGDILTWSTADGATARTDYRAVDPNSREKSTWPSAGDLNVKADGVIESRACVDEVRPSRGNTGLLG